MGGTDQHLLHAACIGRAPGMPAWSQEAWLPAACLHLKQSFHSLHLFMQRHTHIHAFSPCTLRTARAALLRLLQLPPLPSPPPAEQYTTIGGVDIVSGHALGSSACVNLAQKLQVCVSWRLLLGWELLEWLARPRLGIQEKPSC